jgi:hypothetical protein
MPSDYDNQEVVQMSDQIREQPDSFPFEDPNAISRTAVYDTHGHVEVPVKQPHQSLDLNYYPASSTTLVSSLR